MSAHGSFSTKRWARVAVITKEILRERLDTALKEGGYVHRLAPVALMPRLQRKLAELRDEGLLSDALFEEYRGSLSFSCPPEVSEPRTVIVVAWPSPAVKIRFQLQSGPLEATVPPTYISSEGRERCLDDPPRGPGAGRACGRPGNGAREAAGRPHRPGPVRAQQSRLRARNGYVRSAGHLLHRRRSGGRRVRVQGQPTPELLPALSQLPPRLPDRLHPLRRHGHRCPSLPHLFQRARGGLARGPRSRESTTAWWVACVARPCVPPTATTCARRRW